MGGGEDECNNDQDKGLFSDLAGYAAGSGHYPPQDGPYPPHGSHGYPYPPPGGYTPAGYPPQGGYPPNDYPPPTVYPGPSASHYPGHGEPGMGTILAGGAAAAAAAYGAHHLTDGHSGYGHYGATEMDVVPENILQLLLVAGNSSTLDKALENLVELARTTDGRSDLASKNMLITTTLHLCRSLMFTLCGDTLLLALKLIRNLCAGEMRNQDLFIELNGVDIVSNIISSKKVVNDLNYGIIRMGLRVLANVSLAGEEHQIVIWNRICSLEFTEIAKLRRKEICDPLCMIIYVCIEENHELLDQLCSDRGLPLFLEIVCTASVVGFEENWLKLILSRTCVEESYFTPLFSKLLYGC